MIPVTSHYAKEFIMKIACIIPSRYASTRLPGKPLRLIAGETLVHRVYERAVQAKLPDVVIVATDHEDSLGIFI